MYPLTNQEVKAIAALSNEIFEKILHFADAEFYTEDAIPTEAFEVYYLGEIIGKEKNKEKKAVKEQQFKTFKLACKFKEVFEEYLETFELEERKQVESGLLSRNAVDRLKAMLAGFSEEEKKQINLNYLLLWFIEYGVTQAKELVIEKAPEESTVQESQQEVKQATQQEEKIILQAPETGKTETLPVPIQELALAVAQQLQNVNNQQINIQQVNVNHGQQQSHQDGKQRYTAGERIERSKQFQKLSETYAKIEAKFQLFNEFLAGYSGDEKSSIVLKNGNYEVEIFNANTMMKTLILVREDLEKIVADYKNKVETFVM